MKKKHNVHITTEEDTQHRMTCGSNKEHEEVNNTEEEEEDGEGQEEE